LVDAPIGRSLQNRQKMSVRADGREAQTAFTVLERFDDYTLVDANLLTGRTHQIRVHFAFIGHPVAGDVVYGRRRFPPALKRQFLHARELRLKSPVDSAEHHFVAPLPEDLQQTLNLLHRQRPTFPPEGASGESASAHSPDEAGDDA
jgi:23S rRNA pseudouridine1911/1915/1917 synthase